MARSPGVRLSLIVNSPETKELAKYDIMRAEEPPARGVVSHNWDEEFYYFLQFTPFCRIQYEHYSLQHRSQIRLWRAEFQAYARDHLPTLTYHHSTRVYHYGIAMKCYLVPEWEFTDETYFLTCMLHDIGATAENIRQAKSQT
ncbi:hypothetical protein P175DRAFT_0534157 [Aspergillus ochraceoroseus IBT 24754]|uniref:HD domain-containing protein n=1 Tax=Aspergillus ochraceoroseus IBT 24754 TaxID=1392256 RepID=A0A2T5LTU2_9EURO|nr:uncharacterized protein P175DRAFT_0534157 [Aspergillus ochraceoroseus IBT 24754]PTU19702.1 hypothetical protein P175DRAFT_0534157 [Aspergillus ochraceoroseus IBT 24754]